jgi:hypothetical protein
MLIDGKDYQVDYNRVPLFITPTQIHGYVRRAYPDNWFGRLSVNGESDGGNVVLHGYAYPTNDRSVFTFTASDFHPEKKRRVYGAYRFNYESGKVLNLSGGDRYFEDTWEEADKAAKSALDFYWLSPTISLYDMSGADWYSTYTSDKQAFIVRSSSTRQYWAGCWTADKCEVFASVGPFSDYQLSVAALVEFGVTNFGSKNIQGDPGQMPSAQAQEAQAQEAQAVIVETWRPF